MPRVPCHCISHKCGGNLVDQRTQRSHRLRDQQIGLCDEQTPSKSQPTDPDRAELASQARTEVIQAELDVISEYLASTTLSDISPSLYRPTNASTTRNQRISRVLERLSEMESEISQLHEEVQRKLLHSQTPAFLDSKRFPLADLMDKCTHLSTDLKKITYKSLAVTAARDSIQEQAEILTKTLHEAKNHWKKMREARNCVQAHRKGDMQYRNGRFSVHSSLPVTHIS